MLEGLGRVSTIVRGMKEFSHVDRSNEKTLSDINRAIESTLIVGRNEFKYVADVETHLGELPQVLCHLGDLNQVFLNLLVNAAHAIEDSTKGTHAKGKICVSTRLDGTGWKSQFPILAAEFPRRPVTKFLILFSPRKKLERAPGKDWRLLGRSWSKNTAERCTLLRKSVKARHFSFGCPWVAPQCARRLWSHERILFVDDEVSILDGLKRMLRPLRAEWEMTFSPGAEPALAVLESKTFDVIVTDMRMPGMDGAALLEIVREKYPAMLRIILSGYTELQASLRAVPVAHQFLLKPCDPEVLRAGIARATSLGEVLDSRMLTSLVGALRDLPSLPHIFAELKLLLSNPKTTLEQVTRLVERDIAISAKLLQLVNSAFFGLAHEVTDVKTAVNCLGMTVLYDLVLTSEVFRSFSANEFVSTKYLDEFNVHSQLSARIAAGIAATCRMSPAVVLAALLHDVGKLVIAERTPAHFARASRQAEHEGRPLYEVEESLTHISHAEVGAYLLSLWGFPFNVVEAVGGIIITRVAFRKTGSTWCWWCMSLISWRWSAPPSQTARWPRSGTWSCWS